MEAEQEKQAETSRPKSTGPGEQLQSARIRKGFSLEDVANRMHLSASILEAIEDNHFEEITAPIFVKGYLRAYARIVGLDEDDMIQQYLALYSEEDPPISSTSNLAPELSSNDTRVKWTTYLVIVLLAIMLGAWWWNKQQNLEPPVSLGVQAPATASNEAAAEATGAEEMQSETVIAEVVVDEPVESEVVDSEVVASSEAGLESASGDSVAAEVSVQPEAADEVIATPVVEAEPVAPEAEPVALDESADVGIADEAPETVPSVDSDAVDESIVAQESPAEPAAGTRERPARAAPVGEDNLRIVVHADTWADVKDSNNYQLEYNLLRAGSTAEFTGAAPFTVFLGNGHGVEVLFNGEEIGFASSIRDDNTARLNVGG